MRNYWIKSISKTIFILLLYVAGYTILVKYGFLKEFTGDGTRGERGISDYREIYYLILFVTIVLTAKWFMGSRKRK